MRIENEPALVIHQRRYRETSLLVELITQDYGRIGVVAKGARRPKSKLRGVLQAFTPIAVSWLSRGELGTLVQAEGQGRSVRLAGERLVSGLYLNELIYRLCGRNDPHPGLFASYVLAVDGLKQFGPYETVLRIFEKRLLEAIGYGLVLDRTGDTDQALEPNRQYVYVPEHGALSLETHPKSGEYPTIEGAALLALANEDLANPAHLAAAKRLMRAAIAPYLGNRPLATRAMFASLPRRGSGLPQG